MYGLIKFLFYVISGFRDLLNVDRNALATIPSPTKYLAMIFLSVFWCLAFGLYMGELVMIGYNMIGHIAIVSMAFVTWYVFGTMKSNSVFRSPYEVLRDPMRIPKCYEMTDDEIQEAIMRLNRNKWNDHDLAQQDRSN